MNKLPEYCNIWFQEIKISDDDGWDDLLNKISEYVESLESDKSKYLNDKISTLLNPLNRVTELGFKSNKATHQEEINQFLSNASNDAQYLVSRLKDLLNKVIQNDKSDKLNDAKPIKLNLNRAETLALMESILDVCSLEKVSKSDLFRFCSRNFISKESKERQSYETYKEAFYDDLYVNNSKTGLEMYDDKKSSILNNLKEVSNYINAK